jgi:hypothetical protein
MTLATILSLCIVGFAPAGLPAELVQTAAQTPQNQTSSTQPSQNQAQQNQAGAAQQNQNAGPDSKAQVPPASQGQTPGAAPTPGQKKRWAHKKKATASASPDCQPAPATGAASADAAGGSQSAAPPSASGTNPAPANATPSNQNPPNKGASNTAPSPGSGPANCPPAKTVVREGGTSEPSIQLIGGKGAEQTSKQRSTTDRLLESTEDNLKKVAGRQLSASQQEMVNQIQQFIQQSKAAVSAGDVERGRNLAQKAHLLSDELVKP